MTRARAATGLLGLLALAATATRAGEVRVTSVRPESVSVTIYRDFLALVTETRTVDLPAEAVTLRFEGVIDTLLPQSAVVNGTGRAAAEGNYDYDRLTPGNLLRKSVGRTVTLVRTDPATGRLSEMNAIVSATRDGVLLRSADGAEALRCSGLPERLTFTEVPGELQSTPTLSIKLAAGTPGRHTVQVSYVALGFGWNADYVARRAPDGKSMQLAGWISLHNFTDSSFSGAHVQLVAGRLNLLDVEQRGSSPIGHWGEYAEDDFVELMREQKLRELQDEARRDTPSYDLVSGCYPLGKTTEGLPSDPGTIRKLQASVDSIAAQDVGELDEIVVVRERHEAERESLADYQLYRLPWATDLNSRQSKQVAFLHKDDVAVERFYRVKINDVAFDDVTEKLPLQPDVMVGWHNDAASGLGEPLPAGRVRVFERAEEPLAREIFAGEARIPDSPVGSPVEFSIGHASQLVVELQPLREPGNAALVWAMIAGRLGVDFDFEVLNDKANSVTVEIVQGADIDGFSSMRVSSPLPFARKLGDYAWRLEVPANSTGSLSYRIKGKVRRDSL